MTIQNTDLEALWGECSCSNPELLQMDRDQITEVHAYAQARSPSGWEESQGCDPIDGIGLSYRTEGGDMELLHDGAVSMGTLNLGSEIAQRLGVPFRIWVSSRAPLTFGATS